MSLCYLINILGIGDIISKMIQEQYFSEESDGELKLVNQDDTNS